jgi:hypothetical protein
MPTKKPVNKWIKVLAVIQKHGKKTIGSAAILVCLYLLIVGKLSIEVMASVVVTLVASGYLPKIKDDDDESGN